MPASDTPIPQPPTRPLVGNLPDLDAGKGVLGMVEVAQEYGPIVRIQVFNRNIVVVSSQELVNEVCDETRFGKVLGTALREVREFAGDGLFTAETLEPNWQKAHRILMPAFGPAALRRMFSGMDDIAEQLMLKWERLGPAARIDVSDNATRLTLDTIALCSFSYRFNSLYREATGAPQAEANAWMDEVGTPARTVRGGHLQPRPAPSCRAFRRAAKAVRRGRARA
jgi:cytochrome P450/NADPH-cytochrome P450 reductase